MTQCQWIGGGEGCKDLALEGRSYCLHHYGQVYQVGTAVRRKKDKRRAEAVWDIENALNEAVQELIDEGYDFNEDRWAPEVEEA
jgi:hypothetical protein